MDIDLGRERQWVGLGLGCLWLCAGGRKGADDGVGGLGVVTDRRKGEVGGGVGLSDEFGSKVFECSQSSGPFLSQKINVLRTIHSLKDS